jgi:hypothetical protein
MRNVDRFRTLPELKLFLGTRWWGDWWSVCLRPLNQSLTTGRRSKCCRRLWQNIIGFIADMQTDHRSRFVRRTPLELELFCLHLKWGICNAVGPIQGSFEIANTPSSQWLFEAFGYSQRSIARVQSTLIVYGSIHSSESIHECVQRLYLGKIARFGLV